MGDLRQPEITNTSTKEGSSGLERASNLLFDQFIQGDFSVLRNARPLLAEACQLNTLTLTDERKETELAVRANLDTADTQMQLRNSQFNARFNFTPDNGWNNPLRRPTYDLEAQTTDRRSMLSVVSKDGAAPDVLVKSVGDNFSINYTRNPDSNQLSMSADGGPSLPIKLDFNHAFRNRATSFGLRTELPDASTRVNVSAQDGLSPTFQFAHSRDGLSIDYLRNSVSNQLTFSAETGGIMPMNFDLGYDFRQNNSTLGLRGQLSPRSEFGFGASIGPHNHYDANFQLQIGGIPRTK